MVNNLIKLLLGLISRNNFWVLEISCILTSPQSFVSKTHSIIQKIILPLCEECVLLLLHTLYQHPVFASSLITLLMSSCFFPPNTAQLWYKMHLCSYLPCCIAANTVSTLQLYWCCYCNICNWKTFKILNQLWSV